MSLNIDNILTIGAIVILKNGNMAMVTGYCHIKNNITYDYIGVNYPGGININDKEYIYFNNNDIDTIEHEGYSNDDSKKYKKDFINMINKMVDKNE